MARIRRFSRWLFPLAGLLLLFVGVPTALALLGDVDGDDDVDATDAQQVLEAFIGFRVLTPQQEADADVDGDGLVGVSDAVLIQQLLSGEITEFPPRLPQRSSPIALTRDGELLGVVNPDSDTVTFVDTSTDTVLSEVPVGREPAGVAFTRSGAKAYVTNARDANVSVIDTSTLSVVGTIGVGVEPFGVAVSFRGDRAYVSNMASGTVSVIDTATDVVVGTASVGFQPQGLAVTRESDAVYVAHLKGGEVSVIDAGTLAVTSIPLAEIPFDDLNPTIPAGIPNRMKGIGIHPTLDEAWLPHQLSNSGNFVETLFNTSIFPAVGVIDTSTNTELTSERMTLFSGINTVVASAEAVDFSPDGSEAYVVSASSDDLTVFDTATRQEVGLVRDVGDQPRGVVVSPDGLRAYVFNRLTPEVSVVDLVGETLASTIPVSTDPLPANLANGRRLFLTSSPPEVAQDRFFGCEGCHFDGRDDGQTWFFTNGPRQTLSMAGGTNDPNRHVTGLLHHIGDRENVQDFRFTFTRLQNGTGLTEDQLNDLADFTNAGIRFLGNPFLNPDGSRTASARRGRRLFAQAGCAECHRFPFFTDAEMDLANPVLHDVGIFAAGTGSQDANDKTRDQDGVAGGTVRPAGSFESTFLLGVWATQPFLHDARAATLLDVLTTDNPTDAHGVTSSLTAPELADLVAYMQQLDLTNSRVAIRFPADGSRVVALTEVRGVVLPNVVSVDVIVNGDTGNPIAANVAGGEFVAGVPGAQVPALGAGALFDLTAVATTSDGEPGRDDVEVEANFGAAADASMSTVEADPALITADGVSTSTVTITPRDGLGDPVGTGLVIEAQATQGPLGAVVDVGDGTYEAVLTSLTAAVSSTLTANELGQATFADTAVVTFAAGDVDASTSSLQGSPTILEADGIATSSVTVVPRDAFGNDLGAGQAVMVSVDLGTVTGASDQGDGTYTATYTAATATGPATVMATVNGVPLLAAPGITLVPDVTPPGEADLAEISFATPVGGVSQVAGGAGSVEPFATVTATNSDTLVMTMGVADADGSFALSIAVAANEEVCFALADVAGNPGPVVCLVPFPVPFESVTGFVQTPTGPDSYASVAGVLVELVNIDLTDPCNPVFLGVGPTLTDTTAGDGSYEIVLPNGFISDLDLDPDGIALAVISGPDVAPADGRVDSPPDRLNLVNDLDQDVLVDEFTGELNFLICDDVCSVGAPSTHFSPSENLAIEATLRDATAELDFSGLPFGQISFDVEDDVFFDVDGAKDAFDQIAFDTYCEAASTPGEGVLPPIVSGQILVPSSGGDVALPGVLVDLATISIDPLSAISIRTATSDGAGTYTIGLAGSPPHGVIAVGNLTYDGAGNPGAFSGAGSQFFLGTFVTKPQNPLDVDLAGRASMNLIEIPAVPIANFNPTELDQLTALCRSKIDAAIGGAIPLANRTLDQVFGDAFNVCATDLEVQQLLMSIADPEGNGCNLSASPTTAEADGFTQIEITVEPVDQLAQRVGPGLTVDLTSTLGTIKSPAIDDRDGLYTTFLRAPTVAGTATIDAVVDGAGCPTPLDVVFTADVTAPASPDASRILITALGATTVTLVGLPGAAEPFSQVTVENLTQATSVTVMAAADGSFRVDLLGAISDNLAVRAADAATNTSGDTPIVVTAATLLPTVTNPGDPPGAVTLTPLSLPGLGAPVPVGYTFLRGFTLGIAGGGDATAPLEVLIRSGVPIPPGSDPLLVQAIDVAGTRVLRAVSAAGRSASLLFPRSDPSFPGVIEPGDYAYLAADQPQVFLHGTIAGTRGAIWNAEVTADVSPFVDLSRPDGSYLLAAGAGQTATVGAAVVTHEAPVETDPVGLPFGGAQVVCDVDLPTRADRSFAFTGRFLGVGGITETLAGLPSDAQLYVALKNAGDIAIVDTDTLTQVSLAEDAQSLQDLAFTPNGFEAFIGYFSRVRDFTVSIEEPGLLISTVGFPKAVTIPPDGNHALIASSLDNSSADADPDAVFVLDTFTNQLEPGSIPVDSNPAALTTNGDGSRAYTVSETQGSLTVIDLPNRTVLDTVAAGVQPVDVVTDASELYVADAAGGNVLVFDAALAEDGIPANELLATIAVGGAPSALALTPDHTMLLVTEQSDDTLSVIDVASRTVTDVWAITDLPPDVTVRRDGTRAYVLDRQTNPGVLELVLADADTTAPRVVDVGPKERPDDLLQDMAVEIVFDEKMNPATLTGANISVLDEFDAPIPGSFAPKNGDVSALFTPTAGTRYLLNSQVSVEVGTGVTDAAGNPLPSLVSRMVPTFTMQLPNLAFISVDLTTSGIEVNGVAGAVEPNSKVKVTNLLSLAQFTATAAGDGSFSMVVQGLDDDGYELVTSLFGGRAATDPLPLPVSFTIVLPDPLLVSYQPGLAGTVDAVGAPGAVDPQSSRIQIHNLTSGQIFQTTSVNPDGSFQLGIFADPGDALELVSTILGAIVLDPVALASPNLPAPVIEFVSPDRFIQGDPVTLSIVGTDFGSVPANLVLEVDGVLRNDFLLDTLDEDPSKDVIVVDLVVGADSGAVTVTHAGQTSNTVPYFAELAENTSPFAEEVISSNTVGDPNGALGVADSSFVELGEGGDITLRLGSTVEDGSGNDFQIFEDTSDGSDCYDVEVSASSVGPFDALGQFCGNAFLNLSGHEPIRFVRIVDAADGGNSAHIGSVFAIRVPLSLSISMGGGEGSPLLLADVSAMIQESDTFVCPEETENFSVTVSPAPTGGGGYGGGCSDTITWSVAGGGTVMPTNGASTTYTAPMIGGTTSTITVTVVRTGNCASTGTDTKTVTVDVIEIASVEWMQDTSPLDANGYPVASGAIGMRIFPDRTTAAGANRDNVKVVATVNPARMDVPVHFKAFDPDDPSFSTAPVDGNDVAGPPAMPMGGDNVCGGGYSGYQTRASFAIGAIASSCTAGTPKQGMLSAAMANTNASGMAQVDFKVSWQPGNNFRVAAACKADDFNMPVMLTDHNVPPDPANDMAMIGMFPGKLTDLLTVWRKLRVERDSMGAPPAGVNDVLGSFGDFVGVGNLATQATEIQGTSVAFNSSDGSGNLDNPVVRQWINGVMVNRMVNGGRFDTGMLTIGNTGTTQTINPIGKNGNNRVQFPQTPILPLSFRAEDNDSSILTLPKEQIFGTVTQVQKVGATFVWSLNVTAQDETPIDWPDFLGGGAITVGGGGLRAITAVNPMATPPTVTTAGMNIPFRITDDDVLPANVPQPDSSYIATALARAHIVVDFVTGQDSPNGAFVLNNGFPQQATSIKAVKAQPVAIPEYWTVTVHQGFQLEATQDNDPNDEGTYRGVALFGTPGCMAGECGVFMSEEVTRDWLVTVYNDGGKNCVPAPPAGVSCGDPDNNGAMGYPGGAAGRQTRRAEIFDHEVGHLLTLIHPDGNGTAAQALGGVMDPSPTRRHHDYTDLSISKIRHLIRPQ